MKKLNWLFLSMMLFLGMGTAFADGDEGETPTPPVVLAKPTFSHPTNSTLIWGTQVTISTTETGEDVSIRYTTNPNLVLAANKGGEYKSPIAINKAQTIKAITVKGEQISEEETATYTVKLSETTLVPATGETIKQKSEITSTIPAELASNTSKNIFLLYVEGDDMQTVLETEEDILERLEYAMGMAAQGMQISYPNLGTDYKVAVYSPDYESWIFPITAPEQDGTFKIRARAVIFGTSSGDLVYGDEMTATYTVSGEGDVIDKSIGLPVFSVEGAVAAGTELVLTPTRADEVFYVIDNEDVELNYDNFAKFKCFIYTESAPIKIYKGQTIRAVSAKFISGSETDKTFEYSDVKTVTFTVNGGDQLDKMPTLTVTPEVLKVAQGGSVTFSCTMDPQNYAEKIGFAFRAKTASTKGINLEYRLDETSDWTEYTEKVLADLYNYNPIPAIPDNKDFTALDTAGNPYVIDARVCDNRKGVRTVHYRLTVTETTPPVMAVELGYVNAQGKYITVVPDANNYAPLARIPLNIEIYPAAPEFSVEEGRVEEGTKVGISCLTPAAKIYYTVDGTEPTAESTEYTEEISIDSAMTLKAFAIWNQRESSVSTAVYKIKGEEDTLPMPKFNPVGGEVEKGTTVELSCDTADAKIYYSINADTVTVNSLEYTAAISIDSNMTIKAIAVKDDFINSNVAEASYTIKEETANYSAEELQGVSIYPNPSEGMFYIELPVEAMVEVFATNGALVRSFTATAGKATLKLDRSGIYFVRITGEGRSTVKRVIVR